MRFRTKDLMITVVPRVEAAINPELKQFCLMDTRICVGAVSHEITCPRATATYDFGGCTGCPRTTVWTICTDPGFTLRTLIVNDRQELAVLREELQETIKQLDDIEKQLPTGFATKANAKAMADALDGVADKIRKASSGLK